LKTADSGDLFENAGVIDRYWQSSTCPAGYSGEEGGRDEQDSGEVITIPEGGHYSSA